MNKPEPWESLDGVATVETAAGKVGIRSIGDGVQIFAPGLKEPIALVDLYHVLNPEHPYKKGLVQLVIDDQQREDPVAFVVFRPEGTRIEFEVGVAEQRDGFHGYHEA